MLEPVAGYHKDGAVYQGEAGKKFLIDKNTISLNVKNVCSWFVNDVKPGAIFEISFSNEEDISSKLIVFFSGSFNCVNTYTAGNDFSLSKVPEIERRKFAFRPFNSNILNIDSRNNFSLYPDDVLKSGCINSFVKNVKCVKLNDGFILAVLLNDKVSFHFVNLEKSVSKEISICNEAVTESNFFNFRLEDFEALKTGLSVANGILSLKLEKILEIKKTC